MATFEPRHERNCRSEGAALEVSSAKELNGLLCPPWRVTEVPILPGDSFEGNTCRSYHSLGGHCQVWFILNNLKV